MIFLESVKMNLANKLTTLRILLIPVMVLFFYVGQPAVAAIIFFGAVMTDIWDGKIARKRDMVTVFGKFVDPIADKLINISAFIMIACSASERWLIVMYAIGAMIVIARELIVTSFRALAIGEGVVIAADKWGKLKTIVQDIAIISLFLSMQFFNFKILHISSLDYIFYFGNVTYIVSIILTIVSGVNYFTSNQTVLDRIKENI